MLRCQKRTRVLRGIDCSFVATKFARPYRFLKNQSRRGRNLLLSRGLARRVELAELEVRKQCLDGRGGLAVRRREHHRQLHFPHVAADFLACVVRRVVQEEHRVFLPTRRVLVELDD